MPEQPQRVLGGQVLEGLDSGGKELQRAERSRSTCRVRSQTAL
jgi:hypothetical protein